MEMYNRHCPKCHGAVYREDWDPADEFSCINCGEECVRRDGQFIPYRDLPEVQKRRESVEKGGFPAGRERNPAYRMEV